MFFIEAAYPRPTSEQYPPPQNPYPNPQAPTLTAQFKGNKAASLAAIELFDSGFTPDQLQAIFPDASPSTPPSPPPSSSAPKPAPPKPAPSSSSTAPTSSNQRQASYPNRRKPSPTTPTIPVPNSTHPAGSGVVDVVVSGPDHAPTVLVTARERSWKPGSFTGFGS